MVRESARLVTGGVIGSIEGVCCSPVASLAGIVHPAIITIIHSRMAEGRIECIYQFPRDEGKNRIIMFRKNQDIISYYCRMQKEFVMQAVDLPVFIIMIR